jgi:hypothetical protein
MKLKIVDERKLLKADDLWCHAGEVVTLLGFNGAVHGPYLICTESEHDTRKAPELINGSSVTFLVNLVTGNRRNAEPSSAYQLIQSTLTLE